MLPFVDVTIFIESTDNVLHCAERIYTVICDRKLHKNQTVAGSSSNTYENNDEDLQDNRDFPFHSTFYAVVWLRKWKP